MTDQGDTDTRTPRSWVTVHGPPERVAAFESIFGTTTVPVLQLLPVPTLNNLPIGQQLVYELNVAALTGVQRRRLLEYGVRWFGMSPAEAEEELEARGFPILAEHCSFTTRAMEFL